MAIIKRLFAFILVFFRHEAQEQEPAESRPKRRRKKAPAADDEWTMAALLGRLENEHGRHKLKSSKFTGISRWQRKALRNVGPMVIPWRRNWVPEVSDGDIGRSVVIDDLVGSRPPPIMWLGFNHSDLYIEKNDPSDDPAYPISVFAIRDSVSPEWNLEKTPGARYLLGASVAFTDNVEVSMMSYVTVELETGRVHVPRMFSHRHVRTPSGYIYSQKQYATANHEFFADDEKRATAYIARVFAGLLKTWRELDQHYLVATRKNKERVTFAVHPGDQVRFFRDREKEAVACDGKRKRIVHHVVAHTRVMADGSTTEVKEHLRGIRRFTWNGYKVSVTVPGFHAALHQFSAAPHDVSDARANDSIPLERGVAWLVDTQDTMTYSHGER